MATTEQLADGGESKIKNSDVRGKQVFSEFSRACRALPFVHDKIYQGPDPREGENGTRLIALLVSGLMLVG